MLKLVVSHGKTVRTNRTLQDIKVGGEYTLLSTNPLNSNIRVKVQRVVAGQLLISPLKGVIAYESGKTGTEAIVTPDRLV